MESRELTAALEKHQENVLQTVSTKIESGLSEMRKELKLPATRNGQAITDGDRPSGVEYVGEGWQNEPLKGKGLMFARAIRCWVAAKTANVPLKEMAKDWKIPDGLLERLTDRDGAVAKAQDVDSVNKALGGSSISTGGALVPDQFSTEFIELLRANVILVNNKVTRIPMSSKTLTISRQASPAVAAWLGESQNITKSEQTFDDIQLSLKKLGCLTPISNELLRDNQIASDIIVRNDLLAIAVREMDLRAIRGLGTAYTPKGVLNMLASGQLFNSFAAGTASLTAAIQDLNKAIRLVKEGNVPFTKDTAFWLMAPRTEAGYRQLRDGVGRPFFAAEMDNGKLLGYPFYTSTQIPTNLSGHGSGGSAESEVYFVVGPELIVGEGLQPTIEVARNAAYFDGTAVQSGLSRDETSVMIVLRVDFALRHNVAGGVVQGVVDGT